MTFENDREGFKRKKVGRRLKAALILNGLVILIETTGGLSASSLGLLSDALHNVVDEGTLLLTLYAFAQRFKPASGRRTFGFHRTEVMAAWVNSIALGLMTLGIMMVGLYRVIYPVAVRGKIMWAVGLGASLGNLGVALVLRESSKKSANIRSAYLHNLGDALISLSPVLGGVLISATGWTVIDPLIGFGIGAAILVGIFGIFKEANIILLKSAPAGLDAEKIAAFIRSTPDVRNVHDLHIWAEGEELRLLTCQLLVKDMPISRGDRLLKALRKELFERFGISHATIQLETISCHPQLLYCDLQRRLAHSMGASADKEAMGDRSRIDIG